MASLAAILNKHPFPEEIKKLISPSVFERLMEEFSKITISSLEDWEEYAKTHHPELGQTVKNFIREAVRKELIIRPEEKKEKDKEKSEEEEEKEKHAPHAAHQEESEEERERKRKEELQKLPNKEALEEIKQDLKNKGTPQEQLDNQAKVELMRLRNEQFIQQKIKDQREQVKTHFENLARRGKIISSGTQETPPLKPPQQPVLAQQQRRPFFFGGFPTDREQKKPNVPYLRHRALNWATRGRYSAAKQAFSSWANRSRVGRATTKTLGGINRFAKILNLANLAQHPGEAAKSYAEQYAAQKALGFAGRGLLRGGGAFGRLAGGLMRQATGGIVSFAASSLSAVGGLVGGLGGGTVALIVGAIILVIVLIIFIVVLILNATPSSITTTPIPGLNLSLSGPKAVSNSEDIQYSVGVSYNPPTNEFPIETITIADRLPDNTTFVGATRSYTCDPSPCDANSRIISWALANAENRNGFTITLKPTGKDIMVENMVFAQAQASSQPININASDFNSLMIGQGRNTSVLGNEANFVNTVLQNGARLLDNVQNPSYYVRLIYQVAVAKNVNPLAVLAIWGTEQGFQLKSPEFGCDPRGGNFPGFEAQLNCSVNTLINWMNYFEKNKNSNGTLTLPSNIGKNCVYSDPFLFAAEKYGPECTIYDANDFFRSNFVKYAKIFVGQ